MSKLLKKSLAVAMSLAIVATTSAITAFATTNDTQTDKVVWVNGKDEKAAKDATQAELDAVKVYKTESFTYAGPYSGGKWEVAVVPGEDTTVATFVNLFTGTKMDKTAAANGKKLASAKIKEGVVTVTAGKEGGKFVVWLYETRNKKVVNETVASVEVKPVSYKFTTKVAGSSLAIYEDASKDKIKYDDKGIVKNSNLKAAKPAMELKSGESSQTKVKFLVVDSKAKLDKDNTFLIYTNDATADAGFISDEKGKLGYNKDIVTVTKGSLSEVTGADSDKFYAYSFEVEPKAAGKTTVSVLDVQSGKVVKLSVVVTETFKVKIAGGIKYSYTDYAKNKVEATASSAVEVRIPKGAALKMDAPEGKYMTIKDDTSTVLKDKGASVKIEKAIEIETKDYRTVTITGAAGKSVVKVNGKAVKSGDKVKDGDSIEVIPENGKQVVDGTPSGISDGKVNGNVSVTFKAAPTT